MPPSTDLRRAIRPALAALIAAAGLSACATVGPNFHRPAAPTVEGYAMAGDKAPAAQGPRVAAAGDAAHDWWTAFGSPELNQVMEQALAGSPTLAEAIATLAQAREALNAQQGALKPQVTGNAGLQRERINFNAFGFPGQNPTLTLYSIGGNVGYDLDLFGGKKRAVEGARAAAEAEARRAQAAYLTLTGQVATQAVRIATVRAQIAAVQDILADDHTNLELVRKAEAAGGAATSAKVGAEAQLAQDETLLPPLERELAEARHALALLVGRAPAAWSAPDFDLAQMTLPAEIPVSVPSELVRRRPDILAAEADLHAATAQIGVQTAKLYPDVSVGAGLAQGAIRPSQIFSYDATGWNIGPTVNFPLLNGGILKANKRNAEAAARAAMANYQQTVLTAFVQVADTLQALTQDAAALKAATAARDAAAANLRDQRLAFEKGGGTLLGVLDAQRQLHYARRGLALAEGQRFADAARLYVAAAADWRLGDKTGGTARGR